MLPVAIKHWPSSTIPLYLIVPREIGSSFDSFERTKEIPLNDENESRALVGALRLHDGSLGALLFTFDEGYSRRRI